MQISSSHSCSASCCLRPATAGEGGPPHSHTTSEITINVKSRMSTKRIGLCRKHTQTFRGSLGEYAASRVAITKSLFITHNKVAGLSLSSISSSSFSSTAEDSFSLSPPEAFRPSTSESTSSLISLPSSGAGARRYSTLATNSKFFTTLKQ